MAERAAGTSRARRRAVWTLALGLTVACAAAASAQVDPYATVERQTTQNDLDSDVTPVAKQTDFWTLVHGAEFGDTGVIDGSVTTFDTDLFDVAFKDALLGLAGGSACTTTPIQERGESDAAFGARVAACDGPLGPHSPVLYRYIDREDGSDAGWQKLPLSAGDEAGYVGGIAWIDSERALIVGGTGTYPRREPFADGLEPTDPAKTDPAGKARAWIYSQATDSVSELDLSALTPDEPERAGMRGLSAVDCVNPNLCFAGGLGQIWEFKDGGFTDRRIDALTPGSEFQDAFLFRYRVRDIDGGTAVTAGCCSSNDLENTPRVISCSATSCIATRFDERAPIDVGSYPESLNTPESIDPTNPDTHIDNPLRAQCRRPTAHDVFGNDRCTVYMPEEARRSIDIPAVGGEPVIPSEANRSRRQWNDHPEWPDSIYSLFGATSILTPGGPKQSVERPSVIRTPGSVGMVGVGQVLATSRLLAADGDRLGADPKRVARLNTIPTTCNGFTLDVLAPCLVPDGIPDWIVGELRSSERADLGAQGLLVATARGPYLNDTINKGRKTTPPNADEVADGTWEPVDQEKLDAWVDSRHFLLPSYTANAIDIIGADDDGWMVGNHGAILRMSDNARAATTAASEPTPPRLGSRRGRPLSDREAYTEAQPQLVQSAGLVPALGSLTDQADEPQMVPSGALAGKIVQIVMSRDGSDGVAIGNDAGGPTFAHYDGAVWTRCDPVGIPGQFVPDPECADMAPLRNGSTQLVSATRVPLENDSDPTNDEDFEVLAVGSRYQGAETGGDPLSPVVRYRKGRWSFAERSMQAPLAGEISGFAFTGPKDGWMLKAGNAVLHFNGTVWTHCGSNWASCGDDARRVPFEGGNPNDKLEGLSTAGERVYLFGSRRVGPNAGTNDPAGIQRREVPLILYRDPNGQWTDGFGPNGDRAGLDPGWSDPATPEAGWVNALSVVQRPDGGYEGWAVGTFGRGVQNRLRERARAVMEAAVLMRLDADGWSHYRNAGALDDYMRSTFVGGGRFLSLGRLQVIYPSNQHPDGVFIGQDLGSNGASRLFGFEASRGRFEALDSERPVRQFRSASGAGPFGNLQAMAPDGTGGFWAAVSGHMFHYTDRIPRPVFEEASNPLGIRDVGIRDIAAGLDGSVWVATDSDRIFRRDPVGGWEEVRVPGWEPGRIVVRAAAANAIAIGPGGEGLLVGEGGRIANLSPDSVALDPAAGRSCALGAAPPCGTSRDLSEVDIAPDGSALIAAGGMTLLWREAGGDFQTIDRPPVPSATQVTAISYPTPDRAYLATNTGQVLRGEMSAPGKWRWHAEPGPAASDVVAPNQQGTALPILDLAIDAEGHGYAVGGQDAVVLGSNEGFVMERTPQGGWRQVGGFHPGRLTAVELAPAGDGVLIGARHGQIFTGEGSELGVARHGAFQGQLDLSGKVVGFAYMPGQSDGTVDAWAATAGAGDGDVRLMRYRSEAADVTAMLDTAPHTLEELAIATFGKADCEVPATHPCLEMNATTSTNEVVLQRTIDELAARHDHGILDLAVWSGDVSDSAGELGSSLADYERLGPEPAGLVSEVHTLGQLKHRRFAEFVADELETRGVPFFGAIGANDLSEAFVCDYGTFTGQCARPKGVVSAGENFSWREAFARRAEPWGDGSDALEAEGELQFVPVPGSTDGAVRVEDQRFEPDGEGIVPEITFAIGGASTHYALDVVRVDEPVARIVVVDTSMRSLAASDPLQQPQEPGGQARFLERMLCMKGETSSGADPCTREQGQKVVVVSNAPTYSYGPGALTHTATDATTFETLMLRYDVDLVVSGSLGFNGLYYTLAPGVHEPCPGGKHPKAPPEGDLPDCIGGAEVLDANELLAEQRLRGAYPTLIAAGAGGKFGPDGRLSADGPAGQWHGYSVARLMPDGEVVIEQRPILDWIGMDATEHALGAREKLALNGYGRSPISTNQGAATRGAFHYAINNAAITHRYELVLADPEEPWVPCKGTDVACVALQEKLAAETPADEDCDPYLCLPERIATVDRLSGEVTAGNGKYPDTFAVATLSVGEKVATWPLYFKRSPAFVVSPVLGAPAIEGLPAGTGSAPAPPQPPSPPQPNVPQTNVPQTPALPVTPPLAAAQPPEPQPPAPPAPPPPTEQPSPLSLTLAPPGIAIATPTAVIQPPTPPVNPAPPGGARREARQRQAATQKSGADSDATSEGESHQGDHTKASAGDLGMSRRDRTRPEPSFTALVDRDQPSAWAQGALYTGGIALVAFALAAGWSRGRPTPRQRPPEVPAPAWSRAARRRYR